MKENEKIYLPGLNGLRAIAAISVLLSHVFDPTFGYWGDAVESMNLRLFTDGVTLFFVISGFLITYLLLKEVENKSDVNIPKFYMRRILRIWPLYYGVLLIAILIAIILGQTSEILNQNLWYYIFFAANIPFLSRSGIAFIVHYWSIGVEEQFYLFWPWIVKKVGKKILYFSIILFVAWLTLKLGSYLLYTNKSFIYRFFNVTRFHCMMIGAIGAILYEKQNKYFNAIFSNKYILIAAWLLIILAGFYIENIPALIRAEYVALLSLCLIMSQVNKRQVVLNLENKYLDFVGKISYGIYVIHPLVIITVSKIYATYIHTRLNTCSFTVVYYF